MKKGRGHFAPELKASIEQHEREWKKRLPETIRDPQRHPESPRDTWRHPERPGHTWRHPERPEEIQSPPETPKDTQTHLKTSRVPQTHLKTSRVPQRYPETPRDLETPRDTRSDHQPEKYTSHMMFICLYMFTEWTKFNKLNVILQPFIPTLKVSFFWSMFSLFKQLKTRKENLSASWLKSELIFMFEAQVTGCCGSCSAACRAKSLHHHMEAPHQ